MMTNYFLNVFLLLKGDRGLSGDKGEKVSVLLGNVKVYDLHHCAHTHAVCYLFIQHLIFFTGLLHPASRWC